MKEIIQNCSPTLAGIKCAGLVSLKLTRGDIDRIDRQQRILFAIFEQMLKTDQVVNIPDIYAAVQENIDTNLDTLQIATLAWFAKDLSMDDIARHTVPGNGQYVGSTSYFIV